MLLGTPNQSITALKVYPFEQATTHELLLVLEFILWAF